MYPRLQVLLFILSLNIPCPAQDTGDKILMTVDGRAVPAGEFIRMYSRSGEPANPKDLDEYLNQFILFKLKVADAIHMGLDTTKAFRTELRGYRSQLAQKYLTDPEAKEKLTKQAYQRSLVELNGWHILVSLPSQANPEDTLKAWKKAIGIKERILQGEDFEQVARSSSDNPSVKINGGHLGYFTAFQMIMPFEDAAYGLRNGQLSDPVRSPFGYHIIRITDRRPSSGKIKVAHIMLALPPGSSEKKIKDASDTINMIYKKLLAGASFAELAGRYSDHRESAAKGGEMNWFGAGEVINDFSEQAFHLKKNGDISAPFRTVYGWHIIKRIDRKPPGTYEEMKPQLEAKISDSYLNSIGRKSFIEKLKKEYRYTENSKVISWFIENTDTLKMKGIGKYDRSLLPAGNVYTFAGQKLSAAELAAYIEKRGSIVNTSDPLIFINRTIETCLQDQMLAYENSILERKYPDFRYLMSEFHDGILLFEISGRRVWNKPDTDTAGFRKYYEKNNTKYFTPELAEGKIYSLKLKNGMKALSAAYEKNRMKPDCDARLLKKFTVKGDTLLSIKSGTWAKGENSVADLATWQSGLWQVQKDNFPSLVIFTKIVSPLPLPFSKVRNELAPVWQDYLERSWIEQLKAQYNVKIDNIVLEEIRKKLANG